MALQEEFEKQGNFLFKNRSVLPLIILSVGLFVFIKYQIDTFVNKESVFQSFYEYICLLVSFIGQAIRVYTVGHTPRNTSGRNTGGQLADEINTTGIYSTVRHPLYVGNFFMWLGIAMLTMNFWFIISFVLLYWVYYERIMFAEEQFLRKKFDTPYLEWAEKTPAFIPSLKNFVKPRLRFSWKKVVKKEKNGILGIFFLFFIFKSIENYIDNEIIFTTDWSLYTLILGIIFYAGVKILSKKTDFLKEEDVY